MKTITITVSDRCYVDLIRHFAKPEEDSFGRPLVSVERLVAIDGETEFDIQAECFDVQGFE